MRFQDLKCTSGRNGGGGNFDFLIPRRNRVAIKNTMFNLTYRRLAIQQQHAIVIGACGALGKAVTESIARVAPDVHITTIDVAPSSSPHHIQLDQHETDANLTKCLTQLDLSSPTASTTTSLIVNCAGGFGMSFSPADTMSLSSNMHSMNVISALLAVQIANSLPNNTARDSSKVRPLVVLTGAAAALDNPHETPVFMQPYYSSKKTVHDIVKSTAAANTKAEKEEKGNLEGKTFYDLNAVCPSIIDTAVNRADMPEFDWDNESVKCEDIAERIVGEWWLGDQHIMNE